MNVGNKPNMTKLKTLGQRPRNPDIQRCTWKSSPPKLLRINKAVMTAIVVQILQSWSLHELKVFFAVTVQRVQFNSLIVFLVEGVAGGQSDQCRSWRNSRWPWSGVNFTISLTHQIFSSASVPLCNHSHWRRESEGHNHKYSLSPGAMCFTLNADTYPQQIIAPYIKY